MSKKKKKTESTKTQAPPLPKATNINDVLIHLINAICSLVNAGNIVGVVLLVFSVIFMMVAWRIPEEAIPETLEAFLSFDYGYVTFLLAALGLSIYGNIRQREVYHAHIEKITKTRDDVIYKVETKEYVQLADRRSSGIDVEDTDHDC